MRLYLFLNLLVFCSISWGHSITLKTGAFKETKGELKIAIHKSQETYLSKKKKAYKLLEIKVKSAQETTVFDLEPGEYAITLFHDVNSNNKLDKNLLGIPTEPIGFSNNKKIVFGPPNYKKSSFFVENDLVLKIKLKNIL